MNPEKNNDVMEIDLLELLDALRRRILLLIFTGTIGGVIAVLISIFLISPIYTATTKILVLTKETTLASLADLQMGSQLTNDYQVLIKSRPVLQQVVEDLSLPVNYQQLGSSIAISNPSNTRILEIQVKNTDPVLSAKIANHLAKVSSSFIGEQMEVVPPKIVEDAIVPDRKTSPSHSRNLMIGVLLGLLLSGGIVCFNTIMDDSIKTEDEIRKYLDLPMLARVPDRKDFINKAEKDAAGGKAGIRKLRGRRPSAGDTAEAGGTESSEAEEEPAETMNPETEEEPVVTMNPETEKTVAETRNPETEETAADPGESGETDRHKEEV